MGKILIHRRCNLSGSSCGVAAVRPASYRHIGQSVAFEKGVRIATAATQSVSRESKANENILFTLSSRWSVGRQMNVLSIGTLVLLFLTTHSELIYLYATSSISISKFPSSQRHVFWSGQFFLELIFNGGLFGIGLLKNRSATFLMSKTFFPEMF